MSKSKVVHPHMRSPFMYVDENGYWLPATTSVEIRSDMEQPAKAKIGGAVIAFTWCDDLRAGGVDWGWLRPDDESRRRVLEGID